MPSRSLFLLPFLLACALPARAGEPYCGADTPHPIDAALEAAMERSGGVTVDMREAQSAAYEAWDAELNRRYRELMDATAEADRGALRAAQRAWLAFHEAESAWLWTGSMHGEEGTSGPLNLAAAGLERLRQRVCELGRYRTYHDETQDAPDDGY